MENTLSQTTSNKSSLIYRVLSEQASFIENIILIHRINHNKTNHLCWKVLTCLALKVRRLIRVNLTISMHLCFGETESITKKG
jgi:ATP-dependent protease ClpP protease subunit